MSKSIEESKHLIDLEHQSIKRDAKDVQPMKKII
jgi:hypothetical protein